MGISATQTLCTNGAESSHIPPLELPAYALQALELLENAGFEAWVVGGFVRDALLGRAQGDVDIATAAPWQKTERLFADAGWITVRTGVGHGTMTVQKGPNPHEAIEITTYRKDGAYLDCRHPSEVTFVDSIEEDLARRDFTINAMAYHPQRGFCDPLGGRADLQAGVIRAVGKPKERFREDALRILRACHFRSTLGFAFDPKTYQAMYMGKRFLTAVSAERAVRELELLLLGEHAGDALMETVDVLAIVLPELQAMKGFDQHSPYHVYDVLEHTARVVDGVPRRPLDRWAALFHDMGKPASFFIDETGRGHFAAHQNVSLVLARGIMGRLLFPRALRRKISLLVRYHDTAIEPSVETVKRLLRLFGGDEELFLALCDLKRADSMAKSPEGFQRAQKAVQLKELLREVKENDEVFLLRDLAINGNDLLELGLEPGARMGELLGCLLDAVIEGKVVNRPADLRAYALVLMNS